MRKTTDIKIKKIEVRNEKVCPILTEIEISKIEQSKNTQSKVNLISIFNFLKSKIAYISFGFMSFSVALYIFFITSIIVFAVQERSFIFSANQIEINQESVMIVNDVKEDLNKIVSNDKNIALVENVLYIKRISQSENGLSVR
jgi:hypothetical protein